MVDQAELLLAKPRVYIPDPNSLLKSLEAVKRLCVPFTLENHLIA
jgi:hypothetical protein